VQHPVLERDHGLVIDGRRRAWRMLHVAPPQQTILDQSVRADQEYVTGEGRLWLVR
jgi:hypothetical protein